MSSNNNNYYNNNESMIEFVAEASDLFHGGQLLLLIFISFLMGLGNGGVPGFDSIATALVVATASTTNHSLEYSVSLMVPILTMIDIYAAWLHRRRLDWNIIFQLLPLSVIGMWIGQQQQQLGQFMTDRSVRILVGSILLFILLLRMIIMMMMVTKSKNVPSRHKSRKGGSMDEDDNDEETLLDNEESTITISSTSKSKTNKRSKMICTMLATCVVGLLGGAASMLINSMGPILNVYLLSIRKLSPESYVGTKAMFFCGLNTTKIPMRFMAGTLGWPMMPLAICLGIVAMTGVYGAKPILQSMSQQTFVKLELFVVLLCGLKLLLLS
eukprot:scaffold11589_cov117-Cylindrotheca_fusiformis.AAC.2